MSDNKNFRIKRKILDSYMGEEVCALLPEKVRGINDFAFARAKNLQSISLGKSLKKLSGWSFFGCDTLDEITVNQKNKYFCSADGVLLNKKKTVLIKYPSSKKGERYAVAEGVKSIENVAFCYCKNLKCVILPESLEKMESLAFENCEILEEFCVNYNNKFFHTECGVLFNKAMTHLMLFPQNKNIRIYEVPKTVLQIGECAFSRSNLETVVLSQNLKSIGKYAFENCREMTELVIHDKVEKIEEGAFSNCRKLRRLVLPENLKVIESYAFENCENLLLQLHKNTYAHKYARENNLPYKFV